MKIFDQPSLIFYVGFAILCLATVFLLRPSISGPFLKKFGGSWPLWLTALRWPLSIFLLAIVWIAFHTFSEGRPYAYGRDFFAFFYLPWATFVLLFYLRRALIEKNQRHHLLVRWIPSIQITLAMLSFFHLLNRWVFSFEKSVVLTVWLAMASIHLWMLLQALEASQRQRTPGHLSWRFIFRMARIFLIATSLLILLQIFEVPLSGLLTFGGLSTVLVGFGGKEILSNVFSGVVMQLDAPFKVGEEISCPAQKIEGFVEQIGFRVCAIRTYEGTLVTVPHALLSSGVLINVSNRSFRKIDISFVLQEHHVAKITDFLKSIENFLSSECSSNIGESSVVRLDALDDGVECLIRLNTSQTSWSESSALKERILLAILALAEEKNVHLRLDAWGALKEHRSS